MTFRRATLAALALLLPLTAGCGLRLDEPDPSPAPPSEAEGVRQREALRASAYADAAPGGSEAAAALASHAAEHLAALGGVWEPWPDGDGPVDEDGLPLHPSPTADVGPFPDVQGVLGSLAVTTPEVCAAALAEQDPGLATLYSSICVSRTLDWDALAAELGMPGPEAPAAPTDLWTRDAELVRTLDAAAWATDRQAAAARAAGSEGWQALEAQAHRYRELALDSAAANGWAGTTQDPRQPSYDPDALPDQTAIAAALARAATAAVPNSSDRGGVLDLALSSGLTARRADVNLEALPGIG
nr:hypothetical protein [Actinomycetales bacterium]